MIRLIIKPTAHLIKLQTSLLVANIRRQSLSTVRMNVIPIEALSDNYMYLIVDEATKECAAVDPVEPHKIMERIKKENLKLTKVLTTHHHWDHADGNPALVKEMPVPVYGGDDRIPALSNKVGHNETFKIGSNLNVRTLFTPCHTTGHICYYVTVGPNESEEKAVFTGDTLFISGCGRFFEGTAKQMHHALIEVLSKLPSETKVYCGHEYTVQNLKFSLHVEPDNQITVEKLKWSENKRSSKERTIPSTIGDEMKFNPFMRVEHESLKKRYGVSDPIECMAKLRSEKDNWKST